MCQKRSCACACLWDASSFGKIAKFETLGMRTGSYAPLQVFPLYVAQTQSWHSQRGPKNFPGSMASQMQMPQLHFPLPLQILPSGVRQRRKDDSVDSLQTPPTWLGKRKIRFSTTFIMRLKFKRVHTCFFANPNRKDIFPQSWISVSL